MTSGELALRAGVHKETLRFYEREKLLREPDRTPGGYRSFTDRDLQRIVFIKNAQTFGFGLDEIRELLAIADGDIIDRAQVRQIANEKVARIEAQIVNLQRLREVMNDLIHRCRHSGSTAGCPIIETLADESLSETMRKRESR